MVLIAKPLPSRANMKIAKFILLLTIIEGLYAGFVTDRKRDRPAEMNSDEPATVKDVGKWSTKRYCNYGKYAVGFQLKVEGNGGHLNDDTAANSFRLLCAPYKKSGDMDVIDAPPENVGAWGEWSNEIKCSAGSHVKGFRTKTESYQGLAEGINDDTGLNSVEIKCSDGSIKEPNNGGKYGDWGGWVECAEDRFICGFRQKVEASSIWTDMHGMTVLRMDCCDAFLQFTEKKGYWNQLNIANGKVSMTESSITSTSTTNANSHSYTKSLSVAVKAGYSFSDAVSGEITVEGSVASTTARSISRTSTTTNGVSKQHTCPRKYFYQFIMTAKEKRGGTNVGKMEWKSPYFVCTDHRFPKCPGGGCIDADCKICYTKNGYREIKSSLPGDYCVRIISDKVELYKCNGGVSKKWHFIPVSQRQKGKFIIKSKNGKCLGVNHKDYANEVDGGKIEIANCNQNKVEQIWYYEEQQIKSSNGKCLDIAGTPKNSQKVQVDKCKKGSGDQKWILVATRNVDEIFGFKRVFVIGSIVFMVSIVSLCFCVGCIAGFIVFDSRSPFKYNKM